MNKENKQWKKYLASPYFLSIWALILYGISVSHLKTKSHLE